MSCDSLQTLIGNAFAISSRHCSVGMPHDRGGRNRVLCLVSDRLEGMTEPVHPHAGAVNLGLLGQAAKSFDGQIGPSSILPDLDQRTATSRQEQEFGRDRLGMTSFPENLADRVPSLPPERDPSVDSRFSSGELKPLPSNIR